MGASGRVRLVPASPAHLGRVTTRLRAADRRELAAKGLTPKRALRLSLLGASWALTAMLDGEPHAMLGVTTISLIEDRGRPWFLGSEAVYDHPREILHFGPRVLALMHGSFRRLENVVSADNDRAIRLLRRWGFTVEGEKFMVGDVPFVRFWSEADV